MFLRCYIELVTVMSTYELYVRAGRMLGIIKIKSYIKADDDIIREEGHT